MRQLQVGAVESVEQVCWIVFKRHASQSMILWALSGQFLLRETVRCRFRVTPLGARRLSLGRFLQRARSKAKMFDVTGGGGLAPIAAMVLQSEPFRDLARLLQGTLWKVVGALLLLLLLLLLLVAGAGLKARQKEHDSTAAPQRSSLPPCRWSRFTRRPLPFERSLPAREVEVPFSYHQV